MLEFRKEGKYGKLSYGDCDVWLGEQKIAEIRTGFTTRKMRVYFRNEDGYTQISLKYRTISEGLTEAKKIIAKKLYVEANEILTSLRFPIQQEE